MYINGNLITKDQAKNRYDLSFLEFYALVSAIGITHKRIAKENPDHISLYVKCLEKKDLCKYVYNELMYKKLNVRVRTIIDGWNKELEIVNEEDQLGWGHFQTNFINIQKVTNNNKLRSFQYRLLNRAIILNTHLFRWGITNTNLCTFCDKERETLTHILVDCQKVSGLWQSVNNLATRYQRGGIYSKNNIIFNSVHPKANNGLECYCTTGKTVYI